MNYGKGVMRWSFGSHCYAKTLMKKPDCFVCVCVFVEGSGTMHVEIREIQLYLLSRVPLRLLSMDFLLKNSGMFVEWKSAEGNGNGFKVFSKMFNVFHISYAKLQQKHLIYL